MGSNKSRQIIFDHIPENGIGAEIGVWKGDFTMKLLEQTTPSTLHLIDPWAYQPDFGSSWYGNENMTADKMEEIYMDVLSRFANEIRDQQVFVHRLPSDAAAAGFEDEYFDWVYIDGNHDYEFVLKDLESYFPRVKNG